MYQISDEGHSEDAIKSIVQYLSDTHNLNSIRVYDKSNKESWLFRNIRFNQKLPLDFVLVCVSFALTSGLLVYVDMPEDQIMLMKLSM